MFRAQAPGDYAAAESKAAIESFRRPHELRSNIADAYCQGAYGAADRRSGGESLDPERGSRTG